MKLEEIERQLKRHPLFEREIPIEIQLGLPDLYIEKGQLNLRYILHKEIYRNKMLLIYRKSFEIVLSYPFKKIIYYKNTKKDNYFDEPVCKVDAVKMSIQGKEMLKELYKEANQIVTSWNEQKKISKDIYEAYQKKYYKTVEELGLQALYGGQ